MCSAVAEEEESLDSEEINLSRVFLPRSPPPVPDLAGAPIPGLSLSPQPDIQGKVYKGDCCPVLSQPEGPPLISVVSLLILSLRNKVKPCLDGKMSSGLIYLSVTNVHQPQLHIHFFSNPRKCVPLCSRAVSPEDNFTCA